MRYCIDLVLPLDTQDNIINDKVWPNWIVAYRGDVNEGAVGWVGHIHIMSVDRNKFSIQCCPRRQKQRGAKEALQGHPEANLKDDRY